MFTAIVNVRIQRIKVAPDWGDLLLGTGMVVVRIVIKTLTASELAVTARIVRWWIPSIATPKPVPIIGGVIVIVLIACLGQARVVFVAGMVHLNAQIGRVPTMTIVRPCPIWIVPGAVVGRVQV